MEITEREDGVFEVRPVVAVPATEAWFWAERWQAGERDVDAEVAAERVSTFTDHDALIAHLQGLDQAAAESDPGVTPTSAEHR